MNKTIKLLVTKKDHNKRVDLILSKKINFITRTYIKKLIENSQLEIIKDCGHMILFEKAFEMREIVKNFVQKNHK